MVFSKRPVRRSALISPWGVGAMVPFPNDESLMIAGLDMWRYTNVHAFLIRDERLQKRLGVSELRWPPDFRERNVDPENCHLKIPAVRFPTWHYCPFCGTMYKTTYYESQPECDCYQWPTGRKCNPKYKRRKLVPERFVVVCPEGHIDDFPVAEWLHNGEGYEYKEATCRIRRSTGGTSATLSGVFYECTCGAKKSVAGATRPGALQRISYICKGAKPWLGIESDDKHQCGNQDVRVLLRGATNVWFADTRSSIHIPTDEEATSRKIVGILNEYYDFLVRRRNDGERDKDFITKFAEMHRVDPVTLYEAVVARDQHVRSLSEVSCEMSEDEYRLAEYKVLIKDSGSDAQDFHSKNYSSNHYDPIISKFFDSISLVLKLRETRAFVGFSRLAPIDAPVSEKKKMLRTGKENWLPAIEVYGEGIFFEFNVENLKRWAEISNVKNRINKLDRAYSASNFLLKSEGNLRPEFVLIHTFAHLMINQLSYHCGYGSSALRERIYCEKTSDKYNMYGVLIYTASGDSEGSLGGLVRQGKPRRIENIIVDAIKTAEWCTSDPICIQSGGQGPDSCNLAACYNCALLPETSCECGNRFLDRGVLVGTLADKDMGFFKDLCGI